MQFNSSPLFTLLICALILPSVASDDGNKAVVKISKKRKATKISKTKEQLAVKYNVIPNQSSNEPSVVQNETPSTVTLNRSSKEPSVVQNETSSTVTPNQSSKEPSEVQNETPSIVIPSQSSKEPSIVKSLFNFGPHAIDLCSNPVAEITNMKADAQNLRIPPRNNDGSCSDEFCAGDCVSIVINAGGQKGKSNTINVIAGGNLPDPGNCSDIAIDKNDPPGSWDFTGNGACGKGTVGNGFWKNCLVHDTCVWARCTDDTLVSGGILPDGGISDEYCGFSFEHAIQDYIYSRGGECVNDAQCTSPLTCLLTRCVTPQDEGEYCEFDRDCKGYCELFQCFDGSSGDPCNKDSDCQSDLDCNLDNFQLVCGEARPKGEGEYCDEDNDCKGYCELFRCYDGSVGDSCNKDSDCQSGLDCDWENFKLVCKKKKDEGKFCWGDSECQGYCHDLKCWDGSKGDRCGSNSDCKSKKCKNTCWICARKRCN